jgi:hypothetical protein
MKSKRKGSEGKIENNKSDEQMMHKLNVVSDYGNKKQHQYHFRFNDLSIICFDGETTV